MSKKIFDAEGNQIGELCDEQKNVVTDDWDDWQYQYIIWAFWEQLRGLPIKLNGGFAFPLSVPWVLV